MNARGIKIDKAKLLARRTAYDENELAHMKRKYQILLAEKDCLKTRGVIFMNDRKRLGILRKEEASLGFEVELGEAYCKKQAPSLVELAGLMNTNRKLKDEIEQSKRQTLEIEGQLHLVQKSNEKKKKLVQQNKVRVRSLTDSGLTRLENKLDNITKSFCLVLADNKKLQDEVKYLIKERKTFNKLWNRQMKRLNIGKKLVVDLVQQAELAYSKRTIWVKKIKNLQIKAMDVYNLQTEEMRKCQMKLDMNSGLKKFLQTKLQSRIPVGVVNEVRQKRDELKEDLKNRVIKYAEMLDQIKTYTSQSNVDIIAEQFVQREFDNMSKFHYVLKVTDDLEFLARDIEDLHTHMDDERHETMEIVEKEADEIKSLEVELASIIVENDKAEIVTNVKIIELNQIIQGVSSLFTMLKCNRAPLLELLGENETIHQFNIFEYLMILETKFMGVLINAYLSDTENEKFAQELDGYR